MRASTPTVHRSGVLGFAMVFGGAHGYHGARGMILLAAFGVLFSLLALCRRSRRPLRASSERSDHCFDPRFAPLKPFFLIRSSQFSILRSKNCCLFFHRHVVFFLTCAL
jgi:hypothetical protein